MKLEQNCLKIPVLMMAFVGLQSGPNASILLFQNKELSGGSILIQMLPLLEKATSHLHSTHIDPPWTTFSKSTFPSIKHF